ncbi:MAG: hypothetical protein PHU80_06190, partial [Kiritimatiellae bacterium]|nr:hypothetical protein [Kiritimatiellia bacterium]
EEDVLAVFGLVSRKSLEGLAEAVLKGDMAVILKLVAVFDSAGKDMRRLVVELMEHFRNLLVYQFVGEEMANLDVTPEQISVLAEQAVLAEPARVIQIADQLGEMEGRLRFALSVRTMIEMSLIRCARLARAVSLDAVLKKLQEMRTGEEASPEVVPVPCASDKSSSPSKLDLYADPALKHVLKEFDGRVLEVDSVG